MVEVFAVIAMGGAVILAVGSHVLGRRSRANAWLEAARAAGLDDVRLHTRAGWPVRVDGRRGPLSVRISSYHHVETNRAGTRIEIHGVTRALALRVSSGASGGGDDLQVGDEVFDSMIHVSGDERTAAALLDARTRAMVRDLFAQRFSSHRGASAIESVIDMGARLDPGCLVSERQVGDQPVWLAGYLGELLALAERLQVPEDLTDRLLANLHDDLESGVRRANLLLLLQGPASAEARKAAIVAGLEDFDDDVRLEAALEAGSAARPVLLAIANRWAAGDECSARAIEALRSNLPAAEARAILARAVDRRRTRTAEACLASLGHRGPEEAEPIGRVLGAADGPLAVAAARALARVGSAPSIVLLREAAERLPRDRAFQRAVAESVAAIRARLVGAEEGQVSLAGNESGHVSLATTEAGRVSLPRADEVE